jgi:alpha-tubulin suppressor-like RCC1 family protein
MFFLNKNKAGQLGFGDTTKRIIPTLNPTLKDIIQVSASGTQSKILDKNNNCYTIGSNQVKMN